MAKSVRITAADFFSGIFAALVVEDFKSLLYNKAFEEDIAKLFQEFKVYAEQNGFEVLFRIQLHPFHGDSETIHQGILQAMQMGIITLDSPGNRIIRMKLTKDQAIAILNDITGGKLFTNFVLRIIDIFSH